MKKKLALIGIVLIIAAVILFVLSGYLLSSGVGNNIKLTNLTISPGSFSYVPIDYGGNISALAIYAVMQKPTNLYILNNSTFNSWDTYVNGNASASGITRVQDLGVNSSHIFKNATLEVIPIRLSNSPHSNISGTTYVVIDNTQGSNSSNIRFNASISYVELHSSNLLLSAALGYAVFIIGIAGIIILIWGLVSKAPEPKGTDEEQKTKEQKDKEYVDKLYKGIKRRKGS